MQCFLRHTAEVFSDVLEISPSFKSGLASGSREDTIPNEGQLQGSWPAQFCPLHNGFASYMPSLTCSEQRGNEEETLFATASQKGRGDW